MSSDSSEIELVDELLKYRESEWLEFKHNSPCPIKIGELCSALSNSAALVGRHKGYIIWGVDDGSRRVVGTNFDPETTRVGNQELRL